MRYFKNSRAGRLVLAALALVILALGVAWLVSRFAPKANAAYATLTTVRAVRIDYLDIGQSREAVPGLEKQMQAAGVNLVALGAGRVDWTYFPWAGHQADWSAEVRASGVDYLGDDSRRFGQWAHVTAVVDALAPLYIQAHPEAAAVSWTGQPSQNLVGLMDLVEGDFGQQLLALIDVVAGHYPVNSVSLAELVYHVDGYGPRDKAAYLAYAHQTDWPRTAAGAIDIDAASLNAWRSYEIGRFVEKAAAATHKYGKQFFLEVRVQPGDLTGSAPAGSRYDLLLNYADRLVVWGTASPDDRTPDHLQALAQALSAYGKDRVILLLGLWQPADETVAVDKAQQTPISPGALQAELDSARQGGLTSFWITPSFLLSEGHWTALRTTWKAGAATP